MVTILLPLLVCVIGAVVHLLSTKCSALGLQAFWVGLFWTLYLAMTVKIHVG